MQSWFIDAHLHLQENCYDCDRDEVVLRAINAGVEKMICCGISPEDWQEVASIADKYPQVIPAYGIHPWHVKSLPENWEEILIKYLGQNAIIGEIGLDKLLTDNEFNLQKDIFIKQLAIAVKLQRPAVIHCLKAYGPLLECLTQNSPDTFLLHSYCGSVEMIEPFTKLGAYFSFNGKMLQENSKNMHRVIKAAPLDRIFVETDSPYLTPPKQFVQESVWQKNMKNDMDYLRNEPCNIPLIYRGIAKIKGIGENALISQINDNLQAFQT